MVVQSSSNTNSTIAGPDGLNKTSVAISTNIIIKVGPHAVGAVQSLQITEARSIQMIDEVGTDGHIDSVPNKSTDISGSCDRIRFDRMRMTEAFGRAWIHVASQRVPFDIVIIDNWNGDGENAIITTIKNVWVSDLNYTYGANDWIISDKMSWKAETIYSTLANGNAATGGEINRPLAVDAVEQATDVGAHRGSLDTAGLLRAVLPF